MDMSTTGSSSRRGRGGRRAMTRRGTRTGVRDETSFLYSKSTLLNCCLGRVVSSPGMAIFINQAMFFLLCDKVFCPRERLTGLYSLLFYNVAAYLISYGKEIIDARNGYSPYVRVSEHSNVRHLAMSATKVCQHFHTCNSHFYNIIFLLYHIFYIIFSSIFFRLSWT